MMNTKLLVATIILNLWVSPVLFANPDSDFTGGKNEASVAQSFGDIDPQDVNNKALLNEMSRDGETLGEED